MLRRQPVPSIWNPFGVLFVSMFNLAVLLLRLGVGLTFAGHGAQKAFGWWGGPGIRRWQGAVSGMGFRPVPVFTAASVLAELGGGLLLAVGLLTPIAAAILVAQSLVIIFHVHWPKGFWNQAGGIEFALVLGLAAAVVGLLGSGSIALDAALGLSFGDTARATWLLLGVLGGIVSLAVPRLVAHQGSAPATH